MDHLLKIIFLTILWWIVILEYHFLLAYPTVNSFKINLGRLEIISSDFRKKNNERIKSQQDEAQLRAYSLVAKRPVCNGEPRVRFSIGPLLLILSPSITRVLKGQQNKFCWITNHIQPARDESRGRDKTSEKWCAKCFCVSRWDKRIILNEASRKEIPSTRKPQGCKSLMVLKNKKFLACWRDRNNLLFLYIPIKISTVKSWIMEI